MKYFAIEGSSYVGKTTVVDRFSMEGFGVIPEYDAFGPFMHGGESYESLKAAALDVIGRERIRTAMLGRVASKDLIVADRSLFSLVTYEDMMIHVSDSKEKRQLRQDMRSFIVDTLESEVQAGDIALPDAIITLKIDSKDEFESRVRHRGITPVKYLSFFEVQQLIANRVHQYSNLTLGKESSSIIDLSNDSEDMAFNRVRNNMDTIISSTTRNSIRQLEGLSYGDTNAIIEET